MWIHTSPIGLSTPDPNFHENTHTLSKFTCDHIQAKYRKEKKRKPSNNAGSGWKGNADAEDG